MGERDPTRTRRRPSWRRQGVRRAEGLGIMRARVLPTLAAAALLVVVAPRGAAAEEAARRRLHPTPCDKDASFGDYEATEGWEGGKMQRACALEESEGCVKPNLPIINLGMPKSGTTTLHHLMGCMGLSSAHWGCRSSGSTSKACGCHFKVCHEAGEPLLSCSPGYDSYIQMDIVEYSFCHFPQITGVDNLMTNYPDATFVMTTRSPEKWAHSVYYWRAMARRIAYCELPDPFNIDPSSVREENYSDTLSQFYTDHVAFIKAKAAEHGIKLLVVNIEDPKSVSAFLKKMGAKEECWGHQNASSYRPGQEMTPAAGQDGSAEGEGAKEPEVGPPRA